MNEHSTVTTRSLGLREAEPVCLRAGGVVGSPIIVGRVLVSEEQKRGGSVGKTADGKKQRRSRYDSELSSAERGVGIVSSGLRDSCCPGFAAEISRAEAGLGEEEEEDVDPSSWGIWR